MKEAYSATRLLLNKIEEDKAINDELFLKQKKEQEENRRYLESKKFNEESLKCNRLALQQANFSNKIAILSLIIASLSLLVALFH